MYKGLIILPAVAACLFLYCMLCRISFGGNPVKQWMAMLESRDYSRLYFRIQSSGLLFLTQGKITPVHFILLRFLCAACGIAVSFMCGMGLVAALTAAAVCYICPDVCILLAKKIGNRRMLNDIEHLYNLMHLQRRAGAYIVDTITDSYRVVHTWRLKKALLELAGAINGKKPVREAVDEFAAKFDNPYLSTLADIIKHTIESGDTAAMLEDVSEQITGIRQAEYIMVEGKQEMELILLMTLLFIGMAGCLLFLMGISFGEIGGSLY